MSNGPCIGIEYGELELRFAFARDGVPVVVPVELGMAVPKMVYDPQRSISSLGVGFAGILQSVGTGIVFLNGGKQDTPEAYVQRHLRAVRDRVVEMSDAEPGAVVVAVPSSLTESRRNALIECARRAGLPNVTLIDRPLAVALALRKEKDATATFIVFDLDYGDCEYALTRLARGRCWTVGSAILPTVSGERLTVAVMEDLILALREKQVFLGLKQFSSSDWIEFRSTAETVREELARSSAVQIRLKPHFTGLPGTVTIRVEFDRFAAYVRNLLRSGLDDIRALLEQHGLEPGNLDSLLLVGYAAKSSPVRDVMGEAFRELAVPTSDDVLAVGALALAAESAGTPLDLSSFAATTAPSNLRQLRPARDNSASDDGPRFSSVVHIETPQVTITESTTRETGATDRIRMVRKLIDQGMHDEAAALLDTLAIEVDELREHLRLQTPTRAQELLNQAQALIIDQHYVEAVQLAHEAYALAPTDPAIFTSMMRVHADSGVAMDRVEQYERAVQILRCAHEHDQTNREIHRALAQRHFIHAQAMQRLNNVDQAREAAVTALSFDPKHVAANELHLELSKASSPQP